MNEEERFPKQDTIECLKRLEAKVENISEGIQGTREDFQVDLEMYIDQKVAELRDELNGRLERLEDTLEDKAENLTVKVDELGDLFGEVQVIKEAIDDLGADV